MFLNIKFNLFSILDLATRLQELEKQKHNFTGINTLNNENIISFKNNENKEKPTKSAPKIDKATSEILNIKEDKQKKEISGDIVLHRRNDFLQRLEYEMVRNPVFEQRLHSMLRVWSEDSDVPPVVFKFIL